jgi:hypothetical protein
MQLTLKLTLDPLGREASISNIATVGSDQVPAVTSNRTNNPVLPPGVNILTVCAASAPSGNLVTWMTGLDQTGLSGFRVHRALLPTATAFDLVTINPIVIGTSAEYSYVDTTAPAGVQYYYWVEAIARNNLTYFFGPATNNGRCYGATSKAFVPFIQSPPLPLQLSPGGSDEPGPAAVAPATGAEAAAAATSEPSGPTAPSTRDSAAASSPLAGPLPGIAEERRGRDSRRSHAGKTNAS